MGDMNTDLLKYDIDRKTSEYLNNIISHSYSQLLQNSVAWSQHYRYRSLTICLYIYIYIYIQVGVCACVYECKRVYLYYIETYTAYSYTTTAPCPVFMWMKYIHVFIVFPYFDLCSYIFPFTDDRSITRCTLHW